MHTCEIHSRIALDKCEFSLDPRVEQLKIELYYCPWPGCKYFSISSDKDGGRHPLLSHLSQPMGDSERKTGESFFEVKLGRLALEVERIRMMLETLLEREKRYAGDGK